MDERRGTGHLPPGKLPPAVVGAWARGPTGVPAGRRGKKFRRRARRLAGVLAALLVLQSTGPALAAVSFYRASPYVSTAELIDAGSRTFEESLAASPGMREPAGPALASTNLEKAIVSGALSPGSLELPDMMLAGIAGDEMAQSGGKPNSGDEPAGGVPAPGRAGDEDRSPGTIAEVAKEASDGNENGYSSPSLGGDPGPIEEAYAERDTGSGMASDDAPPAPAAEPRGELASAEPAPTISDSGPPAPSILASSPQGVSGEISDEVALGPAASESDAAPWKGPTTPQQPEVPQPHPPEQPQAPEQPETAQQTPSAEPPSLKPEQAFVAPPDSPGAAQPTPAAQDEREDSQSEGPENGVSDELAVAQPSGDGTESTDESTYEGSSGQASQEQSSEASTPETSADHEMEQAVGAWLKDGGVAGGVDAAQEQAVGEHTTSGEDVPDEDFPEEDARVAPPSGQHQASETHPVPHEEQQAPGPTGGEGEGAGQPSGREDSSGHGQHAGGQPVGQEPSAPTDLESSQPPGEPPRDARADGPGAGEPPADSGDAAPGSERGEGPTPDPADARAAGASHQSGSASPDEQKPAQRRPAQEPAQDPSIDHRAPAGSTRDEGASTDPQDARPPSRDRADGGSARDHESATPEDKGGSTGTRPDAGREAGHDGGGDHARDRDQHGDRHGNCQGDHRPHKGRHTAPTAGAGPAKIFVEGNDTSSTIERRQGGDKKVLFEGKIPFDDAVGLAKERFGAALLRDQGDGSQKDASGRSGHADGRSNQDFSPAPDQRFADSPEPSAASGPGRQADGAEDFAAERPELAARRNARAPEQTFAGEPAPETRSHEMQPRDSHQPETARNEGGRATPIPGTKGGGSRHAANAKAVSDELGADGSVQELPARHTNGAASGADLGPQEQSAPDPAPVRVESGAGFERAQAAAARRAEQRAERQATRETAQEAAAARGAALRAAYRAELRARRQEERAAAQATVEVADGAGPGVRPDRFSPAASRAQGAAPAPVGPTVQPTVRQSIGASGTPVPEPVAGEGGYAAPLRPPVQRLAPAKLSPTPQVQSQRLVPARQAAFPVVEPSATTPAGGS